MAALWPHDGGMMTQTPVLVEMWLCQGGTSQSAPKALSAWESPQEQVQNCNGKNGSAAHWQAMVTPFSLPPTQCGHALG